MARCKSCAAPLRANNQNCLYCGLRNDLDLHGRMRFKVVDAESQHSCPSCEKPLQTVDVDTGAGFQLEHCQSCFGLFFKPGQLESLMEEGASQAHHVNLAQLGNINRDRYRRDEAVRYRKCPVCLQFMRRTNYGHRSGVVVDQCRPHGIWLDNGELIHLLEWKKAGGEKLHRQHEQRRETERAAMQASPGSRGASIRHRDAGPPDLENIGDAFSSLLKRIFG